MDIAKYGRERRELIHKADKRLETVPRMMKNQCGGFLRSQIRAAIQYEMVASDYKAAGLSVFVVSCLRNAAGIWMLIDEPERLRACRARITKANQERQTDVWPTLDDETSRHRKGPNHDA